MNESRLNDLKKTYYYRDERKSKEAFFEKEMPEGHVDTVSNSSTKFFIWDRQDSNENVERYGFSHYLSTILYSEDMTVSDGDVVGGNIISITINDEPGTLVERSFSFIGKKYPVLFVTRSFKIDDLVRIVSCRPTIDKYYLSVYWDFKLESNLPKKSPSLPLLPRESFFYNREVQKEWKRTGNVNEKVLRRIKQKSIKEWVRNYKKFIKMIRAKEIDFQKF